MFSVKPGSQSDIFRHVIQSHLQSNRDYHSEKDTNYETPDPDDDQNYGGYDVTWADAEVQDPQADEVVGPSSPDKDGGLQEENQKPQTLPSSSASGGTEAEDDHVPPPKTAPVSGTGGGGGTSGSTRPRRPGPGRRPVTKCRSVPVVYSGETVVRLGQICYQVPRDGS